jgi:ribosomal protein S18 acetylase RimI-like enzyme
LVVADGDQVSALLVRDARPEDREKVEALTRLAYEEFAQTMTPGAWKALDGAVDAVLRDPGDAQCIVAEDESGRIVGSVFLYPAGAAAYDTDAEVTSPEFRLLAVSPSARNRGIGRALVEECARRARASGATELGLHTSKSLAGAIALYEALGFTRAPERDFRPDGAELVQGYRLAL